MDTQAEALDRCSWAGSGSWSGNLPAKPSAQTFSQATSRLSTLVSAKNNAVKRKSQEAVGFCGQCLAGFSFLDCVDTPCLAGFSFLFQVFFVLFFPCFPNQGAETAGFDGVSRVQISPARRPPAAAAAADPGLAPGAGRRGAPRPALLGTLGRWARGWGGRLFYYYYGSGVFFVAFVGMSPSRLDILGQPGRSSDALRRVWFE